MDSDAQELVDRLRAWMQAIVANEVARIEPFVAGDWVLVTPEAGPVERQRFLDAIASGDLTHDAMDLVAEPRVRIYDNSAVITARVQNHGAYKGGAFSADEWTTDVYCKRDGQWQCVLTHLTPVAAS